LTPDTSWSFEPGVLIALLVYLGVYLARWLRVRRADGPRAAGGWRLASFSAGIGVLYIALASPIDRLGEQLFVFHMLQHVLLVDFAAILLILGVTKVLLRPLTARLQPLERAAGPFAGPVFALFFYAGSLWAWHVPFMYQASLEFPFVHVIQHLNFATAGLLFWWQLLSPIPSRRRLRGMGVTFYLVATKFLTGALAAFITFWPEVLYSAYDRQPDWWGLTGAEDQSLAGGLMMFQESLLLSIAFAWLFVRMLSESEEQDRRAERLEDARAQAETDRRERLPVLADGERQAS
jgi:putative membrane protein